MAVRVDTIAGPQLFAKRAAQVASQSGHDLVVTGAADPFLYEQHLVDMGDLVDHLGNRYGGWYAFAKAINGMPTKRALAWGEDQVKLAVQGKLKTEGKA